MLKPAKILDPPVPDTTASGERYLPISMACLQPEYRAPCDLYLKTGGRGYLFFAKKGLDFGHSHRARLQERGVTHLYIRDEDSALYFDYLKETITEIVRNPACQSEQKAAVIHSACQDIMSRVIADPRASFINQAHEIITPTIDLIVSDDTATRHLIQLTAYDHYTYTHSTNVGIFGVALARLLYRPNDFRKIERMGAGFFLHDLGKCRVPIEILNKPGKLTPSEWSVMQRHPAEGFQMLEEAGFLTDEAQIITLQHHEKDDGTGYPNALDRDNIHPLARICRLADVYDAITSDRPYAKRKSTYEALKLMKEQIVADIDQELFEHFVKLFRN
ncbi:HDIG domain-containing protein [Desulfuromonas versatilis]|uniref:HDIG domain-containing protein n=1 Tax=Desulfuromonas versatilis TaxID=2802975 RepID=A0ABN6E0F3_9BACT|nr:HD domain-containing phosphohydrolase [Desulfuromonas versatilis]BCR04616.1 HDIG domain-containing protein [Desulfuromonas versatilis]